MSIRKIKLRIEETKSSIIELNHIQLPKEVYLEKRKNLESEIERLEQKLSDEESLYPIRVFSFIAAGVMIAMVVYAYFKLN